MSNVVSIVPRILERQQVEENRMVDDIFASLAVDGFTDEIVAEVKQYRKETGASLADIQEVATPLQTLHNCSKGHSLLLAVRVLRARNK